MTPRASFNPLRSQNIVQLLTFKHIIQELFSDMRVCVMILYMLQFTFTLFGRCPYQDISFYTTEQVRVKGFAQESSSGSLVVLGFELDLCFSVTPAVK